VLIEASVATMESNALPPLQGTIDLFSGASAETVSPAEKHIVAPIVDSHISQDKENQSVRHWIEKDALKSLRESLETDKVDDAASKEIGPRKALVVGFGNGWTLAGVNLTFGRHATDSYPNLTISDGKHEVKAYLASEQAQSSAFWSRPTLAVGSLIRFEKAEFVEESTFVGVKDEEPAAVEAAAQASATFVLAIRSAVQSLPRKSILDLNRSLKYSREVERWKIRKTGVVEPPEQALEAAQIGPNNEDKKGAEEGEDDGSSSGESANESESTSSDERTEGAARKKKSKAETPKTAARRKHKRKLTQSNSGETTVPNRPPAKKRSVGSAGRGRPSKLSWEDKLGHLKAYKAATGHCNAPVGYKQGDFAVGSWINQLRMGKGSLSDDQKKQLDDLGFIYDMSGKWFVKTGCVGQPLGVACLD
jgi:Helicase associated domain